MREGKTNKKNVTFTPHSVSHRDTQKARGTVNKSASSQGSRGTNPVEICMHVYISYIYKTLNMLLYVQNLRQGQYLVCNSVFK